MKKEIHGLSHPKSKPAYHLMYRVIGKQLYDEIILRQVAQYEGLQGSGQTAIAMSYRRGYPVTSSFLISDMDKALEKPSDNPVDNFPVTLYHRFIPEIASVQTAIASGVKRIVTSSQFFHDISPKSPAFDSNLWLNKYITVKEALNAAGVKLYVNRIMKPDCFVVKLSGGMTGSHGMLLMGRKQLKSSDLLQFDLQFPRKYTTEQKYFRDHVRHEQVALVSIDDTRDIVGYVVKSVPGQSERNVYLVINTEREKNRWTLRHALPSYRPSA